MQRSNKSFEQYHIALSLFRWVILVAPISFMIGVLGAFFLWLLEWATMTRWEYNWLIIFLPLAGLLIHWLYRSFGKNAEAGNNLIMDEIHQPGGGVPFRMTPLILFSTVTTHLFGGSSGREGTAIQMGGSMASYYARKLNLKKEDKRILLMCGMAAGFGAVFGTPVAGAIFALEVLASGRIKYDALIPCLMASLIADLTCSLFQVNHTYYAIAFSSEEAFTFFTFISFDLWLLVKVIITGVLCGLVSFGFAELSKFIKSFSNKLIPRKWLIPVIGGILVIGISLMIGTYDYLGLGVQSQQPDGVSILSAFNEGGAGYWSWFWKLLLTAITLSMGFKGGEVTPLFFIGATLGNAIAMATNAPVDLMAGLGFIAVFAGATNTPIACTLMGVELFGADNVIYYAVACFTAYYFSGHSGIYYSQRIAVAKLHVKNPEDKSPEG